MKKNLSVVDVFSNRSMRQCVVVMLGVLVLLFLPDVCLEAQTVVQPAGDGSAGNPYQVSSLENLYWISQHSTAWDKNYIQTADIDAFPTMSWSGGFPPIAGTNSFTGTYDGNGHIITSLYINQSSNYVGLFGMVYDAVLKNIVLVDVRVTGKSFVGALVGTTASGGTASEHTTIYNCSSAGLVAGAQYVGGLIGYTSDKIVVRACYSAVTLRAAANAGGLLGTHDNGNLTMDSCSSAGSVIAVADGSISGNSCFGGLIGACAYGTVTACHSTGTITHRLSGGSYAGGFIGFNTSATINACYATGDLAVDSCDCVGGFVGSQSAAPISNSYATGFVHGRFDRLGGFAGESTYAMTNCYATGDVQQGVTIPYVASYVGGFAGTCSSTTNCYWDTTTSHQTYPAMTGAIKPTGVSDADMKLSTTFSGWDFSTVWGTNSGVNNGYPYLIGITKTLSASAAALCSVLAAGRTTTAAKISFSSSFGNPVVNFIKVTISGSVDTSDVPWVELWQDNNDNGVVDAGDVLVQRKHTIFLPVCDAVFAPLTLTPSVPLLVACYVRTSVDPSRTAGITIDADDIQSKDIPVAFGGFTLSESALFLPQPSGIGTLADPYLITQASDLYWLAGHTTVWSATFRQTRDIDMDTITDGSVLMPIGSAGAPFIGTYDGGGHTISHLVQTLNGTSCVGLFGYTIGATIKNIGLVSEAIQATNCSAAGGLVAYADSSTVIDSTCVAGTVTGDFIYGGGVVGFLYNASTIRKSTNAATVTCIYDGGNAGGVAGVNCSSTITTSANTGTVTGPSNGAAGGVAGVHYISASISNCYNRGNVIAGTGGTAGGLVGASGGSAVVNSYSAGAVSGPSGATLGGFVGNNDDTTTVTGSYWDVTVSGLGTDGSTSGSSGGIGKGTAGMKVRATYAGWDTTVWSLSDTVYPVLAWQIASKTATAVNHAAGFDVPCSFAMHQNYPNPFNPSTTICFDLPKQATVTLKIYDMLGREAATLINGETIQAGTTSRVWNASKMASGVYFCKLVAGSYTSVKKLLLLK